jgi:hypothetical protein
VTAEEHDPSQASAARRAAQLLRWYPRAWRDRYGEEFAELLISDIEERPHASGRVLDIARGGLVARLADLGLAGCPLPAMAGGAATAQAYRRQASASLGSLGCALAVFLSFASAMWSQLVIASQWAPQSSQLQVAVQALWARIAAGTPQSSLARAPHAPSATAVLTTNVISVAMLVLLGLAVIAAIPPLVTVAVRVAMPSKTPAGTSSSAPADILVGARPAALGSAPSKAAGGTTVIVPVTVPAGERPGRMPLLWPAAVLLAAATYLFISGRHFGNGWPGTGGHGSFVPAGLSAFVWASSMSVSTYWVHPGVLPPAESHWMLASPLALAAAVSAAAILLRRAGLPSRVLALEARLATLACGVMAVILVAAAIWVATNGPLGAAAGNGTSTGALFRAGLIDLAATGMLAVALAIAIQATRTANRALRGARWRAGGPERSGRA